MTLQYLEALKALGASPSTKFIIPIEFTQLLEPLLDFLAPIDDGGDGGTAPARPGRGSATSRAAAGRRA